MIRHRFLLSRFLSGTSSSSTSHNTLEAQMQDSRASGKVAFEQIGNLRRMVADIECKVTELGWRARATRAQGNVARAIEIEHEQTSYRTNLEIIREQLKQAEEAGEQVQVALAMLEELYER